MSTAVEGRPRKADEAVDRGIIDCDVHPHFQNGLHDLSTFMTESWRKKLGLGGASGPSTFPGFVLPLDTLYINCAGPVRGDAVPPNGMPGSDPDFTAKQLFDEHGIHRGVLVAGHLFGIGAFPDPMVSATVASAYNEWQRALWLEHDERYRGLIVVPPQHPEAAAKEIDRLADTPGIVGVFLPVHDIAMGEMHYYPIYEAAQRHELPIVTHPGGTENVYARAPRMALTPTYYIEWKAGLGQVHQSNVLSLICHGVFERFPRLKVLIAEGGFMWAAETMYKLDRDFQGLRDEVPWLRKPPSEYLREHIRFSTQPMVEPHNPAHLKTILEMVYAEETLVFSSDYPHWDFDHPQRALADLPADLRRRIMVDNGRELYGDRLN